MAENKKSVLLYCDIIHTVEELDDCEAGKLFKHYLRYINDQDPPPPDKLTQIVFEPIKQNLKRDLRKWEKKSERNSEIAKARWDKRNDANACERIKVDANDTDKVTVIDKVTDKDIIINNKEGFANMPLPDDLPNILPDIKIGAAKELLKLTRQVDVSNAKLIGMWNVFKVQNLTGKKWYANIDAVYSHYINWIKSQKFESESLQPAAPVKNITEIVDKYNNYDKTLLNKSANA